MCFWTPRTGARDSRPGVSPAGPPAGAVPARWAARSSRGDDAARAVARDVRQIDPVLACHEAHRRRGERPRPGGCRRRLPPVDMPVPVAAAARGGLGRAVPDQHGHPLRRALAVAGGVNGDDGGTDADGLALARQHLDHGPGEGAGQLHDRLLGLDVHQDLVQRHLVTGGHVPGHDLGLGQALAQVGQQEVPDAHACRHRSTSWRMRSASGRKCRSIREGGYGVAKPPTRRTGDSRW